MAVHSLVVWVSVTSSQHFPQQQSLYSFVSHKERVKRNPCKAGCTLLSLWQSVKRRLLLVCRDPEVFHHLPAPALRGRVGSLPCEGGQLIKVTGTQIPPGVRSRDPEHGPETRFIEKKTSVISKVLWGLRVALTWIGPHILSVSDGNLISPVMCRLEFSSMI